MTQSINFYSSVSVLGKKTAGFSIEQLEKNGGLLADNSQNKSNSTENLEACQCQSVKKKWFEQQNLILDLSLQKIC